jgi:transposase-like protein
MKTPFTDSDRARFWAKVRHAAGPACWVWTGAMNPKGYGRFSLGGRMTTAQRASWFLNKSLEMPDGYTVDHLCRNRACVRPDHLEAVPHRINLLRGRTVTARAASATHCPAGHPYDAANTMRPPRGGRVCRACNRARAYAYYTPRANPRRRRPKLTQAERVAIRALIASGYSHSQIAPRFDISIGTVSRVRHSRA